MWIAIVIAIIVVILLIWLVTAYNGLIRRRNQIENAWSQIDVQLKRRHDLVPNLVETVKGYAAHEKSTLDAVIRARNAAVAANTPGEHAAAEGQLTGTLSRLFAVAEAYPDLKANQNMMQLQEELTSTENKVGFARQGYNDAVMAYNTKRESFPDLIVAGMGGFTEARLFEIEQPAEREAPKVKF